MKTDKRYLIALGTALAIALLPGCSRYVDKERKSPTDGTSIELVNEGFDTVGRKWSQTTTTVAQPKTEAPKPVAQEASGAVIRTPLIDLSKRVPAAVTLGQEYTQEMTATAKEDCGNIVITDTIPDGATYVRSSPEATKEGNLLTWKFPSMKKGEVKNIRVTFKADREGELVSCVTITAVPVACVSTVVGKPALTIEKSGAETALINTDVTYRIVVANRGSAVAKGVVVTDELPEGLTHASGQKTVTFNVGDLAPGQSKELTVVARATKTGKLCNVATASAANTGTVKATDDACTTVQKPGLKITKVGDKDQFIGRTAKYTVEVENIGDTTLANVKVVDSAPAPTEILTADGATVANNTATWTVASMAPKEKKSFTVVLTSKVAGNYCNSATATSGDLRESASACTLWKGVAAILVEMVDDPDPVQVGGTTTYTIRITNQGNADLHNVTSVADFEDAVQPTVSAQGKIAGQKVTFPTVPTLAPKASVTYTVTIKAVKAAETINKLRVKCDENSREIEENESTTTY